MLKRKKVPKSAISLDLNHGIKQRTKSGTGKKVCVLVFVNLSITISNDMRTWKAWALLLETKGHFCRAT